MSFYKQITFTVLAFFPILSFATLTVDKETITYREKATIVFSFEKNVKGDVYIAKKIEGQLEYLNKKEQRWISIGNNSAEPYLSGNIVAHKVKEVIVSASANGISTPAAEYTFYLLVVESNKDPFISANWVSIESQIIRVNLPDDLDNENSSENPEPIDFEKNSSLGSEKTILDNQDTTKVVVSLNSLGLSDQYLIVENGGQFWFLNQEGSFGNEAIHFATDVTTVEEEEILLIKAEQIPQGKYILYHVVTEVGDNLFEGADWQMNLDELVNENNKLIFHINLGGN